VTPNVCNDIWEDRLAICVVNVCAQKQVVYALWINTSAVVLTVNMEVGQLLLKVHAEAMGN
jgi:hypothetical protein